MEDEELEAEEIDDGSVNESENKDEVYDLDLKNKIPSEQNTDLPSARRKNLEDRAADLENEAMDDLDLLGDLELEELDNIVSFADNIATKLAMDTSNKLKKMGSSVKNVGKESK